MQELGTSIDQEQAVSQASSSRPTSPSQDPPASSGPLENADADSKSQERKPLVLEIDPVNPDLDWDPSGQLCAAIASAAVCELLNTGYILQGPAAQL